LLFLPMTIPNDSLRIRPGRIRHGNRGSRSPKTFVGEVMRAAKKAGHAGNSFRSSESRGRSFGHGRRAAISIRLRANSRRVVMKARVVRHCRAHVRSASLPKHLPVTPMPPENRDDRS
jgi:hypothetical protein